MAAVSESGKWLLAGAIGGAAGALGMEVFQLAAKYWGPEARQWVEQSADSTHHPQTPQRQREEQKHPQQRDASTARAANKMSEPATGTIFPSPARAVASELLHYAAGILPAALYGAMRGKRHTSLLAGSLFGFSIFVILNQILIPNLGLASKEQA